MTTEAEEREREMPTMDECPHCGSPAPHLHPAVQCEGEVEVCAHEFHLQSHNQNRPEYTAAVIEKQHRRAAMSFV